MAAISEKIYLADLEDTPLGDLRLAASDLGLVAVEWADSQLQMDAYLARLKRPLEQNVEMLKPYLREILAYTNGKLREFTFQIDWDTLRPFQKKAMQAVYAIPYGETRTYSEIAAQIGHPNAP